LTEVELSGFVFVFVFKKISLVKVLLLPRIVILVNFL